MYYKFVDQVGHWLRLCTVVFFQQMEKFLLLTSKVLHVKKLHGSAIVCSLKCSVVELIGRNLLPYFLFRSLRIFFLCCVVNDFML